MAIVTLIPFFAFWEADGVMGDSKLFNLFFRKRPHDTSAMGDLVKPDSTRKGARVQEIASSRSRVLASRLVDNLTEAQAIKLEAELTAAFGTVDTGDLLSNSVLPSGLTFHW